jgi:alkanesulfonate monooxygenase SsuD/methylene tetrahydromethanopterin reductase-like flavin-dependent oxidoreductase (luciferase family)
VIPLDARPPAVIAERVRSLGGPSDRLWLGVGSGGAAGGLARVRAGVDALAELGPRIVVGALGPRMAALAGEVADGVLLNWMTPGYAERMARDVRAASRAAGRPAARVTAYVRCGLLPAAQERLRGELAVYAGIPTYRRHLERMGSDGSATLVTGRHAAAIQAGLGPDETVVRAMTPDDSLDALLALARAAAPPAT